MTGFDQVIKSNETGSVLAPVLYSYLIQGRLPDPLKVKVRGGTGDRPPDGWFHPSSHPLLTSRQLYYYLVDPDAWRPKPFDYTIKMSALIGSLVHEIIETALQDLGFLMIPRGTCASCGMPQPLKCKEFGAVDAEAGTRGHLDGQLNIEGVVSGFEFKTCHPNVLSRVPENDLEAFKTKWPYYFSQVQEYMRMTGLRLFTVLFWSMGNPWEMKEFQVPFDPEYSGSVRAKYLEARRAVEMGSPPPPCCSPGSPTAKSCPAVSCPIKRMR